MVATHPRGIHRCKPISRKTNLIPNLNPSIWVTQDPKKASCIHWAATRGHQGILKLLLEAKGNANCIDKDMMSPLHVAAGRGSKTTCQLMLQYGGSLDAKNTRGASPVDRAKTCGFTQLSAWLTKHKPKRKA